MFFSGSVISYHWSVVLPFVIELFIFDIELFFIKKKQDQKTGFFVDPASDRGEVGVKNPDGVGV